MSLKNAKTIFEHQELEWSKVSNKSKAIKTLEWLEKQQNFKPFKYTAKGIKAKQYVGVISLGGQLVQVLPKIFSKQSHNMSFRQASTMESNSINDSITGIMYLLKLTKKLKINEVELAKLCKHTDSMLEVFIRLFADNLLELLQNDYRRNYVSQEDNLKFVKGKINFTKHLRHNYIDKSKFYCNYDEYESNILLNQLLKATIKKCISSTKSSFAILQKCDQLLIDVDDKRFINPNICKRVKFTRLNQKYEYVFNLAKLLLFGNSPKLTTKENYTFSIMFDMNALFEEAIFEILDSNKSDFDIINIKAQSPQKKIFDEGSIANFTMKPDIYIKKKDGLIIVLDTKYKLIESIRSDYKSSQKQASQSDVYQVFAYSQYYQAEKCILLYPQFEKSFDNEFSSKDIGFNLQISTIDLYLADNVSYKDFIKSLKEKLQKILKAENLS
ncbi:McrC family protein [Francisella salimarina]|uniref:McrC family protein n=1 Tax=Francisella salimarina TaxID=2599927 RepID=UPI003750554F